MRTKAHALIQRRFAERGKTTRIVVMPLPGSGLPDQLVSTGEPVTVDLLAGRPVNLDLDEQGLAADLCFDGPPGRCRFPWSAVLAVQESDDGELAQTVAVTVTVRLEDDSYALLSPPGLQEEETDRGEEEGDEATGGNGNGRPSLRVVPGGKPN